MCLYVWWIHIIFASILWFYASGSKTKKRPHIRSINTSRINPPTAHLFWRSQLRMHVLAAWMDSFPNTYLMNLAVNTINWVFSLALHRLLQHSIDWNRSSPRLSAYLSPNTHIHTHFVSLLVSSLFSLQLCTYREGLLAGEGLTRECKRPICHVCREPCVRSWLLQACQLWGMLTFSSSAVKAHFVSQSRKRLKMSQAMSPFSWMFPFCKQASS